MKKKYSILLIETLFLLIILGCSSPFYSLFEKPTILSVIPKSYNIGILGGINIPASEFIRTDQSIFLKKTSYIDRVPKDIKNALLNSFSTSFDREYSEYHPSFSIIRLQKIQDGIDSQLNNDLYKFIVLGLDRIPWPGNKYLKTDNVIYRIASENIDKELINNICAKLNVDAILICFVTQTYTFQQTVITEWQNRATLQIIGKDGSIFKEFNLFKVGGKLAGATIFSYRDPNIERTNVQLMEQDLAYDLALNIDTNQMSKQVSKGFTPSVWFKADSSVTLYLPVLPKDEAMLCILSEIKDNKELEWETLRIKNTRNYGKKKQGVINIQNPFYNSLSSDSTKYFSFFYMNNDIKSPIYKVHRYIVPNKTINIEDLDDFDDF